ncbi:HD domain-containing protein [Streptomyces sp. NPDC044780]|uniref:HD domain-containing protein n=1 Tax=unclassified Streptomyces TaxID=2593676 RepID=UPI003402C909
MSGDDYSSAFPDTALARTAHTYLTGIAPTSLVNHSLRSYLFARTIGDHQGLHAGADYDDELLFLGCALHDIGLTDEGDGEQRFEVDGADLAARFLIENGLDEDRATIVWDAIALHTSQGIANRKRPEIALTHSGIGADIFGLQADLLPEGHGLSVHADYPRLDLGRDMADIIVAQATAKPHKAPPFTFPGGVLQERSPESAVPGYAQLLAACPWES